MTPREDHGQPEVDPVVVGWMVAGAAVLVALATLVPTAVIWLNDGTAPPVALPRLGAGTVTLVHEGRWADPASAYPPEVRAHMPEATGWWTAAAAVLTLAASVLGAIWRAIDTARARRHLGRRGYQIRGGRPRDWARPRDLRSLAVRRPQHGRFTLGRLDGRLLASDPQSHVAVIAPTRSGKTTRYVIPWLLEHDGPAVVTSTKTDVLAATRKARGRRGEIFVWDPFGPESCGWDPLHRCDDWEHALQQARWLADAAQEGDSQIAAYWRGEAAKLLAPLLHAGAIGKLTIDAVRRWVDTQDTATPFERLKARDAKAAAEQLAAVARLDDRNRGTSYMSAGSLLAAYRHPGALRTTTGGVSAERLLAQPNTLYIVAPEHHQRLLAPLVVALLSSILHAATERANRDQPLKPTLRLLIDEAANIAPLADLPGHLSQAGGHGVRIATIWQSLGQLNARYARAGDTILANSTTKLFMGPIGDRATWSYISELLGTRTEDESTLRSRATPETLQQLGRDRAVLISGSLPPAVVRTRGGAVRTRSHSRMTNCFRDRRARA